MAPSQTDLYKESMIRRLDLRVKLVREKAERIKKNYIGGKKFCDAESEVNRIWLDQFTEGTGFDIACGDFLLGADTQAIGVDGTAKMLGTDFCSEGDNLSFQRDNTLDYVVTNYLDGMPSPLKALREWVRVLKPGGRIGVVCRDSDAYTDDLGVLSNARRQSCYTEKILKNYLYRVGLRHVMVERHPKTLSIRGSGVK